MEKCHAYGLNLKSKMVIVYKNDPVVTDSAKLSWAAKKSKQKQTAYCGAIPDDNRNGWDSVKVGFPRLLE